MIVIQDPDMGQLGSYGLVTNPQFVSLLEKIGSEGANLWELVIQPDQNRYINLVKILDAYAYVSWSHHTRCAEYNPDLILESSKYALWSTIEIEFKITLLSGSDISKIFFRDLAAADFDFGPVRMYTSFERYKLLQHEGCSEESVDCFVILGKRNSKWPMAIKYKRPMAGSILTRKEDIIPYSEDNIKRVIREIVGSNDREVNMISLPSFHKKKWRVISVDKMQGFVFGVSYSIARPLIREVDEFHQIEIEYWSKLVREGESLEESELSSQRDERHFALIRVILSHLRDLGVPYDAISQQTKIRWLNDLYESRRQNP